MQVIKQNIKQQTNMSQQYYEFFGKEPSLNVLNEFIHLFSFQTPIIYK